MNEKELSREHILNEVRNSSHNKIKVAITDIDGVLRGKLMRKDKFLSAVEGGFGFCDVVFGWDSSDVAYDNATYTGWHTGYPDAQARIDLSTFRLVPWEDDVPFFLADFVNAEEKPLGFVREVCSKQLRLNLKRWAINHSSLRSLNGSILLKRQTIYTPKDLQIRSHLHPACSAIPF